MVGKPVLRATTWFLVGGGTAGLAVVCLFVVLGLEPFALANCLPPILLGGTAGVIWQRLKLSQSRLARIHAYKYPLGTVTGDSSEGICSNAEQEAVFRHYPFAYQLLDDGGSIIEINSKWTDLLGYSGEEVRKKLFSSFMSPQDRGRFQSLWTQFKSSGEMREVQFQMLRKNGATIEIAIDGWTTSGSCDDDRQIHCFLRDISRQRKTVETLWQDVARYRDVVEEQMDPICRFRPNGTLSFVNEAFCQFYGKERSVLIGTNIMSLVHEDDRATLDKYLVSLCSDNLVGTLEHRVTLASGETRWQKRTDRAIFDHQSQIVEFQSILHDVTERRRAEAALRESERLFRTTIESTADGILVVDDKGKVLYANRRFAELWRIPDDVLASGDDDKLLEHVLGQLEQPEAFLSKVKELYGTSRIDLDTLHFKDGRVFERYSCPLRMDTDSQPATDRHGAGEERHSAENRASIVGRVWSFRDHTEYYQAQKAWRESDERFRSLFQSSQDCAVILDRNLVYLYANNAANVYLGRVERPIEGLPIREALGEFPDFRDLWINRLEKYFKDEQPVWAEDSLVIGDQTVYSESSLSSIRDSLGNLTAVGIIYRDITKRKRSEEVLIESERRFRNLVEMLPEAVFEVDENGRITFVNSCTSKYFGYTQDELKRLPNALELIASEDRQRVKENNLRVLAGGNSEPIEYLALNKNGETFPIIAHIRPILNRGVTGGMRGVIMDISDREKGGKKSRRPASRKQLVR